MRDENKLKVNMGLKSCDKCEYYLRCEECVGSHYREEMPKLNQRIAELEEQLKNAIALPKYEKGQTIYWISGEKILEGYFQCFNVDVWAEVIINPKEIIDEDGYTDVDFDVDMIWHKITFATKDEALKKLEELRGNDVKD